MAKYHGKKGVVYISTTGTGTATNAIGLNNWSLDQPTDRVETTEFNAGNKTYVQGFKDATGSISGFWDDTENKLFQAGDSSDGCKLYLYPSADAPSKYWYGPAWIDASVTTPIDGAVGVSVTFAANGTWGRL